MSCRTSPTSERPALLLPLVISLWLWGSGCCCGQQIPPPEDVVTDAHELLNRMESRLVGLQSARIRVVSEIYSDDLRGANLRQVVLVRQPRDLHIQILSPFDQTLSMMVANPDALALYDLEAQIYYRGSPTAENIARLLPFYMSAADIVSVLLGGPPLDLLRVDQAELELEWDGDRGSYRLGARLADSGGRLDLWIRHADWLLEAAERSDERSVVVFELRAGEFELFDDVLLPTRLRFLMEGDQPVDMSLAVESIGLNVSLPDHLFVLQPPQGAQIVDLD